jgi:hypothetical protein
LIDRLIDGSSAAAFLLLLLLLIFFCRRSLSGAVRRVRVLVYCEILYSFFSSYFANRGQLWPVVQR